MLPSQLPIDIIIYILQYNDRIKYRNGKFINQIIHNEILSIKITNNLLYNKFNRYDYVNNTYYYKVINLNPIFIQSLSLHKYKIISIKYFNFKNVHFYEIYYNYIDSLYFNDIDLNYDEGDKYYYCNLKKQYLYISNDDYYTYYDN